MAEKKTVKTKNKKSKQDIFIDAATKILIRFCSESRRLRLENEKLLQKIHEQTERSALSVAKCKRQIESFEDSLLHIMHNIKKNQFLYAHYPDEWAKDYRSIKKGIKFENEFIDKKGAVNA